LFCRGYLQSKNLSPEEVDHIALLARLALSPQERERAAAELSQILGYFDKLAELDTEGVEATVHPLVVENVLRADEVRASLPREAALANAPEAAAGMFQVPRVVEAD
jgi:aspartyl-tRNA(Asn)/glutamyl-tRNA(Gln) amidotransferase subunit C